jgi:23S rRNA (uridine2552-2'-O)-methyltransferase
MTDKDKNAPDAPRMSGARPSSPKRRRKREAPKSLEVNARMMDVRVKTARGRKNSSTRWLRRQLNDPYVKKAKIKGYRSRAAFKLIELDEQFDFLKRNITAVDLGAAPGGWSQVAIEQGVKRVVGIDVLPVESLADAEFVEMDFMDERAPEVLIAMLGGPVQLVMSDLAANTTGHKNTDHFRTIALVEYAAEFAFQILKPGGVFVTKVFQGGAEAKLLERLKGRFEYVRHAKPKASRVGSPEIYLVAKGFKG